MADRPKPKFREGDRVLITSPGFQRSVQRATVAQDWDEESLVMVVPEGRTKPVPRAASRLRHEERPAGPPLKVARPSTTKAKLRAVPKPRTPVRSPKYLAFVRSHPCAACQRRESIEAHHWSPERGRGVGQKVSDLCTVPLCPRCHQHFHAHHVLPELDRRTTRALFIESQRGLYLEWIMLLRDHAAERRGDRAR